LNTRVRVQRLDGLGADGLELLPASGEGVVAGDEARHTLRAALVQAGLTAAERDAFIVAWSDALFGRAPRSDAPAAGDVGALDELGRGDDALEPGVAPHAGVAPQGGGSGRRAGPLVGVGVRGGAGGYFGTAEAQHVLGSVADAVLYILPQASVDALLPLAFSPPPRAVQRVFVARVDVSDLDNVVLQVRQLEVTGALDVAWARRIIRRHFSTVRHCLTPTAGARAFRLDLRITTTGAVSEATVDSADLSDEERTCLVRAARRFRFPSVETLSTVSQQFAVAP
jgi:hypothetical protein